LIYCSPSTASLSEVYEKAMGYKPGSEIFKYLEVIAENHHYVSYDVCISVLNIMFPMFNFDVPLGHFLCFTTIFYAKMLHCLHNQFERFSATI